MNRIVQQAMVQVLSLVCKERFSDYSYEFRPERSCGMPTFSIYHIEKNYDKELKNV